MREHVKIILETKHDDGQTTAIVITPDMIEAIQLLPDFNNQGYSLLIFNNNKEQKYRGVEIFLPNMQLTVSSLEYTERKMVVLVKTNKEIK